MRGRRRAAVAAVLVVLAAAVLVRSPALAEGVTTTPSSPILGFDTASAPPSAFMDVWREKSDYQAIGIYIPVDPAVDSRYDKTQQYLNSSWVQHQLGNGWSIIPIYVGLQAPAPCGAYKHAMSTDPAVAYQQGVDAAEDAGDSLASLELPGDAPVYYDLEAYSSGCSTAVQAFVAGWSAELNILGHPSGLYGSRGSTMADLAARVEAPSCSLPSAAWAATGNEKEQDVTISPSHPQAWGTHRQINQFHVATAGEPKESYVGDDGLTYRAQTDKDWVDGPVVGPTVETTLTPVAGPCIPAPPAKMHSVRGNGTATLRWAAPSSDGGSAVMGYQVADLTTGTAHSVMDPTSTSLRITHMRNGTAYSFAVTALNAVGASVQSATVTVTPAGPPKRVAKPTVATAKGRVTVRWRAPAANGSRITGYRVSVGSHHITVRPGARSATVKGLRPGAYRVSVTAVNAVGAGPASPVVRVRLRSRS